MSDTVITSTRPSGPRDREGIPRSATYAGLVAVAVLSLLALFYGFLLFKVDPTLLDREPLMSTLMYKEQDVSWYLLLLVLTIGLLLAWRTANAANHTFAVDRFVDSRAWRRVTVPRIAGLVLVLCSVGTFATGLGFGHSADEYLAVFQAAILADGRLLAKPAEQWRDLVYALYPVFLFHDPTHDLIAAHYRPVYAAIRALFDLAGLQSLTNAVLTALSILLVAGISRQLWPGRNDLAVLAAALLASSPQVLFTGMSGFAWPAHLCLNLAWLWLFLRGGPWGHAGAGAVGLLAAGLHQVHAHALFVMPFMLGLLFERRWRLAAFYATTYGVAHLLWIFWHDVAVLLTTGGAPDSVAGGGGREYISGALELFQALEPTTYILMAQNAFRFVAWQNPILPVMVIVALAHAHRLPPTLRRLAWGMVLSVIPYVLIMPNQYFALGYRYFHGLQGNLVLLAVFGWMVLAERGGLDADRRWARRAFALFTAATLTVGFPLRAWQTTDFISTTHDSLRFVESRPSDIVLVDVADIWFGRDLVRNDPFLRNRPIVLALQILDEEQLRRLCAEYDVEVVGYEDVAPFGSPPTDRYDHADFDRSLEERKRLALAYGPECADR